MGTGAGSFSSSTYDVSSEAQTWYESAAIAPPGFVSRYIQYTYFVLPTPYISAVSTTAGEWYSGFKSIRLENAFITYLANAQVALSAVPNIRSCSAVSGAGAPGVHIRVSFLTTSSAVTSTTNVVLTNKATTTPAVPASQPTPAGSTSTTPSAVITTEVTRSPSAQPSGQPSGQPSDQPSDQPSAQPKSSPSTAPPEVSQEPGSPSQGQTPVDSQGASKVDTVQNTARPATSTPASPIAAPVVIGEVTASPASSKGYVMGSQTLIPGSSAIEVAGTTYSLQASGGVAVVNGQYVQITTLATPTMSIVPVVLGDLTGRPVSSGAYVVADQTLSRGGSAIEISGTTYSLAPSGERVVVNGEARPVSAIQMTSVQPATVVIGDVTAVPASSRAYYVVAGQTISPEGSAIEVSGVTYSLPSSGANVGINGATSYPNVASTPATVLLGSITAALFAGGGYILATQVLSPGGTAIEVSGTTYSLAATGNTVFIDGAPTAVQTAPLTGPTSLANAVNTPTPVVFGSVTATPFIAGGYILATQVLSPGGTAVGVSGTTYSLATSGNTVFVDGKPTEYQSAAAAPLTVGSQISNAVAASVTPLVIGTQTLVPGGSPITISGTTYSLPPSETNSIVVNGRTTSLTQTSGVAILSAHSQQLSFTPLNSGIVVASQTLYPGGTITVNGETLSLANGGSVVIIKSGESTTTEGLGDYIWHGIAASTAASTTESVSGSSSASDSITTSGSKSLASSATTSRTAGTGTGTAGGSAAATTSASRASHMEVGTMSRLSMLICLLLALLVM